MYASINEYARRAMQSANRYAQQFDSMYISAEHVLLGLLDDRENSAVAVLAQQGVEVNLLRAQVEGCRPQLQSIGPAKEIVEGALDEARALGHQAVGTGHVLLGILNCADSVAARILREAGTDVDDTRRLVASNEEFR